MKGSGPPPDTQLAAVADAIRERVLAEWTNSPVRLREDANAEQDQALGGYRDRVLVELAQNAADAAARVGGAGRLLLALRELDGGAVLVAANTGAALDAEGIQALCTLRASAKRAVGEESVGRFGVGFSAVLAVSDEPAVLSRHGGVRFSLQDTHDLVQRAAAGAPDLAGELARRDGHVPVLRLPFPAQGEPPLGYDTAVLLPVRDGAADDLVRRLLADLDDTLLLALPRLSEIAIEVDGTTRVISDVAERWIALRRTGVVDPAMLADRPVEERSRSTWSLTWALPREVGRHSGTERVIHAPTPTDEPLTLPATLIASFPLDPARRHVASGPLTDHLVARAGQAYADLAAELLAATSPRAGWTLAELVPTGLARGGLDAALHAAALEALRRAAVVVPAEPGPPIRPRDAVALTHPAGADVDLVAALAPSVAGLVLAPRAASAALEALGVARLALADVIDQLPLGRTPRQWRALYAALASASADPMLRESLAALPVPLVDGRVVRGVRGCVVVGGSADHGADLGADHPPDHRADHGAVSRALAALGVRAVHPDATHPVLERLGARRITHAGLLDLPELPAAVGASLDAAEDGDLGLTEAVLTLVEAALADGAADDAHRDLLGDLALLDVAGEVAPARELVLPGSPAAELLDPEAVAPVEPALLERWGARVLGAVGVLNGLAVLRLTEVDLTAPDDPGLEELPELAAWLDDVRDAAGPDAWEIVAGEVTAVRDLDVVREGAWPGVLDLLAADPVLRRASVSPVQVTVRGDLGAARRVDLPSWTAWWLRREVFGGELWADPRAQALEQALFGPAPLPVHDLGPDLRRSLGGVLQLEDLGPAELPRLLVALGRDGVDWDAGAAVRVWSHLARLALDGAGSSTGPAGGLAAGLAEGVPARLPALRDGAIHRVERDRLVVVDHPAWLQRPELGAAVVAPPGSGPALADLLDLPLAEDLAEGRVRPEGATRTPVPAAVLAVLPSLPRIWWEHDQLLVDGVEVDWWVEEPGSGGGSPAEAQVHASTLDGLARGLAWAGRAWSLRAVVAAVLDGTITPVEAVIDQILAARTGMGEPAGGEGPRDQRPLPASQRMP
ncbi:MAG: hypothetical protein JNL54_18520 [Kineosporiaceae bacterium]|nr:hypothetical protein [Kineosporiaceae bacterium]